MATISRSELERMRRYTRPEEPTKAENRQRRLKELSDAKVKNWPNTLEATRKKKESWKQERLAEEEAARKKIDAEEAELFHKARRAALDRAKTIVYEQQDKVKNLRSQQMYSDVLYDREEQIREKAVMREWEREKEEAYHAAIRADIMRQIAEGDRRDAAEASARKLKASVIAVQQKNQLSEFRENYLERLRTEKRDGELIQKKAANDLVEDARVKEERHLKAKLRMSEMKLANEELRKLNLEKGLVEQKYEASRVRDVARKEYLEKERFRLEKMRFDARQATKQRLIDRATEELRNRISNDEQRLEEQVEAMRKKEDELEALKQRNILQQKLAIDTSRRQQLEARLKVKREEEQVISDMVTAWKAKNVEIEEEEVAEAEALKKRNMDIRATQEKQIARRRELNRMERAERLGNDKEVIAQLEEDDRQYRALASEEIAKAKAAGRPFYMLEKARQAKDITILPATGSRV